MDRKIVNPDLAEERAKCDFDKREVYEAIMDVEMADRYVKESQYFRDYPELRPTREWYDMSREEQMEDYWRRIRILYQIDRKVFFENLESDAY